MQAMRTNYNEAQFQGGYPSEEIEGKVSRVLREGTRKLHDEVAYSPFAKKLGEAQVTESEYIMYLADLYRIYSTLESYLESCAYLDYISPLCIKGLYRSEALKKDMEYFNAPYSAAGDASYEYQRRLWQIAQQAPHKLIAHVYTRFMGDLFGGRLIEAKFESTWPGGTNFYKYEELCEEYNLTNASRFVTIFRKILDSLSLGETELREVCEEVDWAFKQHKVIFEELSKPSPSRFVYAYAVPCLIACDPRNLGAYIPKELQFWHS